MTLEEIGEWDDALLCVTDLTACCRPPYTVFALGNWFFPNGTRVASGGAQWDFNRARGGQGLVYLNRRRGGVNGIYHCVVPDAMNVTRTIYIGVYTADAGECNNCVVPQSFLELYIYNNIIHNSMQPAHIVRVNQFC